MAGFPTMSAIFWRACREKILKTLDKFLKKRYKNCFEFCKFFSHLLD